MHNQAAHLHSIASGRWLMVGALAALIVTSTTPGEVMTLTAQCTWAAGGQGPQISPLASCNLVVESPIAGDRPVYLAHGWARYYTRPDKTHVLWTDTNACGMPVRAYVWLDGKIKLMDGILTKAGKLMVGGTALDLADGPPVDDQSQ